MFLHVTLMFRCKDKKKKKKHSHMKQWKPKLPLQFTSNAVPRCGTQGLFKDPVFPTVDLLLMVEFCKHFGVWRRWQPPEGVPRWRLSLKRKEKNPQKPSEARCATSDVGQWQPQGSDKFLTRDWLPKPTASCLGPYALTWRK